MVQSHRKIIGIDYSINSPAVCFFEGETFSFEKCRFRFIAQKKNQIIHTNQFHGIELLSKDFSNPLLRYETMFKNVLDDITPDYEMMVEDYSFGSVGRSILSMVENSTIMRYNLFRRGLTINLVSPKTIKKYATGSGNADKSMMYDAFLKETNFDLNLLLSTEGLKNNKPVDDIVDSYFICKYKFESTKN
jgi:Holliday junction resolvasome RuvABC endonuclease subunit